MKVMLFSKMDSIIIETEEMYETSTEECAECERENKGKYLLRIMNKKPFQLFSVKLCDECLKRFVMCVQDTVLSTLAGKIYGFDINKEISIKKRTSKTIGSVAAKVNVIAGVFNKCPNCGIVLDFWVNGQKPYSKISYCPDCGQMLDWER